MVATGRQTCWPHLGIDRGGTRKSGSRSEKETESCRPTHPEQSWRLIELVWQMVPLRLCSAFPDCRRKASFFHTAIDEHHVGVWFSPGFAFSYQNNLITPLVGLQSIAGRKLAFDVASSRGCFQKYYIFRTLRDDTSNFTGQLNGNLVELAARGRIVPLKLRPIVTG